MKDFSKDDIQIGVIGAGVMGRGITQLCAASGINVVLMDIELSACESARDFIFSMLQRAVEKGKLSENNFELAKRCISISAKLEELSNCDLIIEAVVEKLDVKQSLFSKLGKLVKKECILVTNTSSLSVTSIAASCEIPERVAGLHFFNPVPLMKLVEVVNAMRSSESVINELVSLVTRLGHTPVIVADTPGFLVNHCGRGLVTEGLRILSEHVTTPDIIDTVMRDCGGFRMGPFELMDLTGLDVTYPATEQIYQQYFHEPRLRPTPLQKNRYEAGLLGRKVGEGFYQYENNEKKLNPAREFPDVNISASFWVSYKCDVLWRNKICELVNQTGCDFDGADKPGKNSIAIVIPLGCDISTAAINEGLNPVNTIGIETLFNMENRIIVMGNPATSTDTINQSVAMITKSGRTASVINDSAGFITQRIIATIINIACEIAQQGIAKPQDIDSGVKTALGYPQGPLAMGDALGPDCVMTILENMQRVYGDMRYRPSPWLRRRAQLGLSLLHEEGQSV